MWKIIPKDLTIKNNKLHIIATKFDKNWKIIRRQNITGIWIDLGKILLENKEKIRIIKKICDIWDWKRPFSNYFKDFIEKELVKLPEEIKINLKSSNKFKNILSPNPNKSSFKSEKEQIKYIEDKLKELARELNLEEIEKSLPNYYWKFDVMNKTKKIEVLMNLIRYFQIKEKKLKFNYNEVKEFFKSKINYELKEEEFNILIWKFVSETYNWKDKLSKSTLYINKSRFSNSMLNIGVLNSDNNIFEFINNNSSFEPRSDLEENKSKIQIIPQLILKYKNSFLTHKIWEKQSDQRMRGKYPIFVWWHIDIEDILGKENIILTALKREMTEEVKINSKISEFKFLWTTYTTENDISEVHIWLCFLVELENNYVKPSEETATEFAFVDIWELKNRLEELTPWSKIVLNKLY